MPDLDPSDDSLGPDLAGALVHRDGLAVYALSGEVDLACRDELARRVLRLLNEADGHDVKLDMAEVDFMDSTGLRTLLDLAEAAGLCGQRLVIEKPSPQVRRIIEMTGVGDELGL